MLLAGAAFALCLASAAALFGATALTSRLRFGPLLAATVLAAVGYAAVLVTRPGGWLLPDVAVFVMALLLGSSLGLLIKSPVALASFCMAAAVADIVSFSAGPTARLIDAFRDDSSDLLRYLCLSLPLDGRLRPIVGIGDLIILATLFFAFRRLGHRGAGALAAPVAGLLLALVVGLVLGGSIFAVPFMAATSLVYLWMAGRRSRPHGEAHDHEGE